MPIGKKVVPLGALALAICFPFYSGHMFTIPVFGAFPDVTTAVNMLVFIMMAVGLNVVVGYAGLLDLGYVAFYAVGAYTAAWFASLQFAGAKCPKPGISAAELPGRDGAEHRLQPRRDRGDAGKRRHPCDDLAAADRRRAADGA